MIPKMHLKSRALRPDPNLSLFKFKLSWINVDRPAEPKIQTWYSYDYDTERALFPFGLDKDLRIRWKQLLALCWKHSELYEFVKWLRPHSEKQVLYLYLPNWPQIHDRAHALEKQNSWQLLESYSQSCGYEGISFQSINRSHARQAGHSPGRIDFKKFYGFGYIQRNNFILASLGSGKLLKVDIYDNLMYHSENYLETLFGAQINQTQSFINGKQQVQNKD